MTDTMSCLDCVGGYTITSTPVLGSCVTKCRTCQPICPCCDGIGAYPMWTRDPIDFVTDFNHRGLVPILCHSCAGFLSFRAMDHGDTAPETTQEPASQPDVMISIGVHRDDRSSFHVLANSRDDGICAVCDGTTFIAIVKLSTETERPTGKPSKVPCPVCRYDDFIDNPTIREIGL